MNFIKKKFSIERFKTEINDVKVVSFDIFDTAVYRTVKNPTDIFYLLRNLFHENSIPINPGLNIPEIRINSEKKVRDTLWYEKKKSEVVLDEIIHEFCIQLGVDESYFEIIKQIEIELEKKYCIQNTEIFLAYKLAKEMGLKIIFTSDMYLDDISILSILKKCNYDVEPENLFLSSKYEVTKSSSLLYEIITQKLNIQPHDMLHIGDNLKSDFIIPKKIGINALFYPRIQERKEKFQPINTIKKCDSVLFDDDAFLESHFHSIIVKKNYEILEENSLDFFYIFGYQCGGPLILSFCIWLCKTIKYHNYRKIFFLSRDGLLLKKVYDKLRLLDCSLPISSYLYSSRRACNLPAFMKMDENFLSFVINGTSKIPVGVYLERIGINPKKYSKIIKEYHFDDLNSIVESENDYANLKKLFHNEKLCKDITLKATQELEFIEGYFSQEGIYLQKKIPIVDIGWHGSIQKSIETIIHRKDPDISVIGYYLGTHPPIQNHINNGLVCESFLCHAGNPKKIHNIIKKFVEIFEIMLFGDHGTVINFLFNGERYQPNTAKMELSQEQLIKIEQIQKGILDFVNDCLQINGSDIFNFSSSPGNSISRLARVILHPTYEESHYLGELEHVEEFGESIVSIRKIIEYPSATQIIRNPKIILDNRRKSFWIDGYDKRFLRLNFFFQK